MKNEQFGLDVAVRIAEYKWLNQKNKNSTAVNKMLKNDPMITYDHMQENSNEKTGLKTSGNFSFKNKVALTFIAEEILIAMLLALIFYMI